MGRDAFRHHCWPGSRARALVLAVPLALALAANPASSRATAGEGGDVPGADATFAARGVAVVWGVIRGADAAAGTVVMWIASRDPAIRAVSVTLLDAAGERRLQILPPSLIGKAREARAARADFTAYPRAELRFAAAPDALASGASALTVSYAGIPPTTPEFPNEEALAEYLESALGRATGR